MMMQFPFFLLLLLAIREIVAWFSEWREVWRAPNEKMEVKKWGRLGRCISLFKECSYHISILLIYYIEVFSWDLFGFIIDRLTFINYLCIHYYNFSYSSPHYSQLAHVCMTSTNVKNKWGFFPFHFASNVCAFSFRCVYGDEKCFTWRQSVAQLHLFIFSLARIIFTPFSTRYWVTLTLSRGIFWWNFCVLDCQ